MSFPSHYQTDIGGAAYTDGNDRDGWGHDNIDSSSLSYYPEEALDVHDAGCADFQYSAACPAATQHQDLWNQSMQMPDAGRYLTGNNIELLNQAHGMPARDQDSFSWWCSEKARNLEQALRDTKESPAYLEAANLFYQSEQSQMGSGHSPFGFGIAASAPEHFHNPRALRWSAHAPQGSLVPSASAPAMPLSPLSGTIGSSPAVSVASSATVASSAAMTSRATPSRRRRARQSAPVLAPPNVNPAALDRFRLHPSPGLSCPSPRCPYVLRDGFKNLKMNAQQHWNRHHADGSAYKRYLELVHVPCPHCEHVAKCWKAYDNHHGKEHRGLPRKKNGKRFMGVKEEDVKEEEKFEEENVSSVEDVVKEEEEEEYGDVHLWESE